MPRAGTARRRAPQPGLPSSSPASGPAARTARSGAHYRVPGGVRPARLRALVPRCRGAASRFVLWSCRRRPRALPPSLPARLPASLAPSLRSLSRSLSPPPPPGTPLPPSLRLPSSLPPAARGPRPPPAARPPRPRWPGPRRCGAGPGGSADWGALGRRGGSGLGARPVLAPSVRLPGRCGPAGGARTLPGRGLDPQHPDPAWPEHRASAGSGPLHRGPYGSRHPRHHPHSRGALCYLAQPQRWVPASSTGRRDSGPSSPRPAVSSASLPAVRGAPGSLRPAVLPTSARAHCTLPASAPGPGTAAPAPPPQLPPSPPPAPGAAVQWRPPTQQGQGRGARPL